MSSETRPDFRDLESKGYVVIRSFLGENDLSLIKEDIACNKGVWYESYLVSDRKPGFFKILPPSQVLVVRFFSSKVRNYSVFGQLLRSILICIDFQTYPSRFAHSATPFSLGQAAFL